MCRGFGAEKSLTKLEHLFADELKLARKLTLNVVTEGVKVPR